MNCLRLGRGVIRDEVVLKVKDKRLATYSVFLPMVAGDSAANALEPAKGMKIAGIPSFWDGDQVLGRAFAKVVELPKGRKIAWDIYFIYGPDVVWGDAPPKPTYRMHQLAEDERCLDADKFREAVQNDLRAMGSVKHIELLTRKGCSGTTAMRDNLDAAMKELAGWDYEVIDIYKLPKDDPRPAIRRPRFCI